MPGFEFACPHCSRRFALENPPAGEQISCPECGQPLAIPAELPAPSDESLGAASESGTLDFIRPTLSMGSGKGDPKSPTVPPAGEPRLTTPAESPEATATPRVVRQLTRQEKEARRQRRSLILMVGGLVLLIVALIVLSRL